MTIDERIKFAEEHREESFSNCSLYNLSYWTGYIHALKLIVEDGYRKVTDVAREILVEIEDVLNSIGYIDELDIEALKKKYIGSDIYVLTKTEDV